MEEQSYIKVDRTDVKASCRIISLDQNTKGLDPNYLYLCSPPPNPSIAGAINGPLGNI